MEHLSGIVLQDGDWMYVMYNSEEKRYSIKSEAEFNTWLYAPVLEGVPA